MKSAPILSICIPTYNRFNCLNNLLSNISTLKNEYGDEIEICISDNNSVDETRNIIDYWSGRFKLISTTQAQNIGGTKNAIFVSGLASAKWIMVLGDDDELVPSNFESLLLQLRSSAKDDWILVGVSDKNGRAQYLNDLAPGRYDANKFQSIMLRTGIYPYGFVSMHVFPRKMQKIYATFSAAQSQPWPHLALFLRHLHFGHVQVFSDPVVIQSAGGAELFWKSGDWVHVNLRKLNIVYELKKETIKYDYFYNKLILRELYSLTNIKNLIAWKIREPNDFSSRAFSELTSRYNFSGYLSLLSLPHFVLLLTLLSIPVHIIHFGLLLLNKSEILDKYIAEKELKNKFNGVDRGL
jgi:glycosyltransferase involved in cell wall biosynthesis